jgi:hypothetical protein
MTRLDTVLVLLLATPALSFANTDPVRDSVGRRQEQGQLAVDRGWAARDAGELREFEQLTASLKGACRSRLTGRYREVNENLQRAIDREIEQSSVKAAQAAREVALWRVFRKERLEASTTGAGNDMLQAIGESYEHRDDARDRDNAIVRHQDMVRIGTMVGALQNDIGAGDRSAMKRNIALAEQFLSVMRRDVVATQVEGVEDRAELREDPRETRTDRR